MFRLSRRLFSVSLAILVCLAGARAEGLVQLSLRGALASPGGAPVEVRWAAEVEPGQVREAGLRLHLARGTSAHALGTLLVQRLRQAGAKVLFPAEHGSAAGEVQIFVEASTRVSLRLAPGLSSSITTCEVAPSRVRLLKPLLHSEPARLTIQTSTFHAHTRLPGSVLLELPLDSSGTMAQTSEELFEQALANGLVGDRPSADSWRPVRGEDGATVTGCSIELDSERSDWGLEVQLELPFPR